MRLIDEQYTRTAVLREPADEGSGSTSRATR